MPYDSERSTPNWDDQPSDLDHIFGNMLINPKTELTEEIFQMTGMLAEGETIDDFTIEELRAKLTMLAQRCLADPELAKLIIDTYNK